MNGKGGKDCCCAVSYSVLNKAATVEVGSLMLKYGGGGHKVVGTCQFADEDMAEKVPALLKELVEA